MSEQKKPSLPKHQPSQSSQASEVRISESPRPWSLRGLGSPRPWSLVPSLGGSRGESRLVHYNMSLITLITLITLNTSYTLAPSRAWGDPLGSPRGPQRCPGPLLCTSFCLVESSESPGMTQGQSKTGLGHSLGSPLPQICL